MRGRLRIVNDRSIFRAQTQTAYQEPMIRLIICIRSEEIIMTSSKFSLKQLLVAGGALFVAIATPIEAGRFMGYDVDVISVAAAQESHAGKASSQGTKAGAGAQSGGMVDKASGGNQGASGQGSKSTEALLKGEGGSTTGGKASTSAKGGPGEDSDRPPTAGVKGGKSTSGGGKPVGGGTKKGDLFGDIFVLIRDPVTGAALLDAAGLPLVQAYDPATGLPVPGVSIPRDAEGNLILTTYTTKEVEFGRLSVGRSPTKVLDHSLTEALTKLIAADASSTDNIAIVLDASGRLAIATTTTDPVTGLPVTTVKAIDSPLENLALYKAIANLTGTDRTITVAVPASKDGGTAATTLTWTVPTSINIDLLKASLLAAAGDKTGTITLDTVMYINPIVGVTDDLSTFTYDRYTTYKDLTVTVLIKQADGVTYIATPVKVYDVVFSGTNDTTATGAADFATAVNDALQVLEYVHDNAVD
jgi:hypothetical protein